MHCATFACSVLFCSWHLSAHHFFFSLTHFSFWCCYILPQVLVVLSVTTAQGILGWNTLTCDYFDCRWLQQETQFQEHIWLAHQQLCHNQGKPQFWSSLEGQRVAQQLQPQSARPSWNRSFMWQREGVWTFLCFSFQWCLPSNHMKIATLCSSCPLLWTQ